MVCAGENVRLVPVGSYVLTDFDALCVERYQRTPCLSPFVDGMADALNLPAFLRCQAVLQAEAKRRERAACE
jgi:hypothetical protein